MFKHVTLSIALVVAMMAIAVEAKATSITGGISFAGSASPAGGSDWSSATGVHFSTILPIYAFNGTGSYSSVIPFAIATFNDFGYDPVLTPSPVHLWTFNYGAATYSFDLASLTSVVDGGSSESSSIAISGLGTLHITNYEDTAGTFIFTSNGANGSFSFSASDGAKASVPEPASVLLLGTGLLGIASMAQRRTKRQKQQL